MLFPLPIGIVARLCCVIGINIKIKFCRKIDSLGCSFILRKPIDFYFMNFFSCYSFSRRVSLVFDFKIC